MPMVRRRIEAAARSGTVRAAASTPSGEHYDLVGKRNRLPGLKRRVLGVIAAPSLLALALMPGVQPLAFKIGLVIAEAASSSE